MLNVKVEVWAPKVPGATPTHEGSAASIDGAWTLAQERFGGRKDLTYQDISLRVNGKCVGYAGPSR